MHDLFFFLATSFRPQPKSIKLKEIIKPENWLMYNLHSTVLLNEMTIITNYLH